MTRVKNGPGVMTGIVREPFAATKEESDEQAIGDCGSGTRSALSVRMRALPAPAPRPEADAGGTFKQPLFHTVGTRNVLCN